MQCVERRCSLTLHEHTRTRVTATSVAWWLSLCTCLLFSHHSSVREPGLRRRQPKLLLKRVQEFKKPNCSIPIGIQGDTHLLVRLGRLFGTTIDVSSIPGRTALCGHCSAAKQPVGLRGARGVARRSGLTPGAGRAAMMGHRSGGTRSEERRFLPRCELDVAYFRL